MIDSLTRLLAGLPAWQATLAVLALSFGGAALVEVVVLRWALRLTGRTETAYDEIVVQELRAPLVITVALAGIYLLTQVPAVVESVLVTQRVVDDFFGKPAIAVIVLAWAWGLNRLVDRAVDELGDRGGRYHFAPVFSNVWTILLAVGAAGSLLMLYDVDVTPILGAAGIAGVAVGFAAKDTVANFFGGIALYFDDTYRIGDYVVLEGGEAGTVVKVGIRSTTLRTRDEVLVTVPNSVLNAAKIVNESAPGRRKRIRVKVGVAYGTDLDEFEGVVLDVAAEEPLVLDSPQPRMRFRAFGDSALQYELLCWVDHPTRAARATHELNRAIYVALGEADIEIPYPKREVTYRTASGGSPAVGSGDAPAVGGGSIDDGRPQATDGGDDADVRGRD
ncbi:MAG: mechanosensitive ion channel family protein [Salinigranum sp.]